MIVQATFENILSFNEKTSISFVAGKSDSHSSHVLRAEKRDDISVLKTAVIYGANAAGKSNIIKAIYLLQMIVLGEWPKGQIEPFKLKDPDLKPSKIELTFKFEDKYYSYGVKCNSQGILEEWLQEINHRSKKEIFSRKKTKKEFVYKFPLAKKTDFLAFLSKGTPDTKSFLSEYMNRHGEDLEPIKKVYTWFDDYLQVIFPESKYDGLSFKFEEDLEFKKAFTDLLSFFNTGVVSIKNIKGVKKEDLNLPPKFIDEIFSSAKPGKKMFLTTPDGEWLFFEMTAHGVVNINKLKTIHEDKNKKQYTFNMSDESDGTIRLLDFLPMLIKLKNEDSVFLIDEIDRSLHPRMSYEILNCYLSYLSPSKQSQLITTTHECHLLNLDLIRQDEVWFVEKDENGASRLTSLAKYKPREDIRKGYLAGHYGAIPCFASLKELKWP